MKRNFLLGKGERLAEDITVRGGGGLLIATEI